jgi:uncharacterized protein YdaU (DUF1376 family)
MSDSKGKYQPWYHESFMSDPRVRRMSSLAAKTYMLLLHEAFVCSTRPNLPDDEDELKLLGWCSDKEWLVVRDPVLGMFAKEEIDGQKLLTNKRLTKDWEHLQEIRETRTEAGRKGGLAKASKSQTDASKCQSSFSKQVSKQVGKQVGKQESEVIEEESDMKIQDEIQSVCVGFGVKAGGFKSNWDEMNVLAVQFKRGAVVRDFTDWMEENQGDDFPKGPVVAYLRVAVDRLSGGTTSVSVVLKSPEVVNLVRELSYAAGGQMAFADKHRVRLAEVLKEFSAEEIKSAFKVWLEANDLSDPYTSKGAANNFAQTADQLCYSAREQKKEVAQTKIAREAAVARLQEEAETDRQAREKLRQTEESFDPLSDLVV